MSKISLSKRGNYWQYRFYLAPVDGTRKQISKSGFRTKKEALIAGTEAFNQYLTKEDPVTNKLISVSDLLDEWFKKYCLPFLRYNTQLDYSFIINNHLKPRFGHYYVKDLTPTLIEEYVFALKSQNYAKNTSVNIVLCLSKALQYAIKTLKIIKQNPVREVQWPEFKPPIRRKLLSKEDFRRIIEHFPEGNSWHLPLMIGYHTGLRIGEVFALTWQDIDFEESTLTVKSTIFKDRHDNYKRKNLADFNAKPIKKYYYLGPTKTRSSTRTIYIDSVLLALLKREKAKQEKYRKLYGLRYIVNYKQQVNDLYGNPRTRVLSATQDIPIFLEEVDFVCKRKDGKLLTIDGFSSCPRIIRNVLGIPFNFHSLRHTHATILIQEGANIKDVQERLGHAKVYTTMDTYVHNTLKIKKDSVKIFERYLNETK